MDVVIIKMLMSALLCFLRTRVTETCPEKLVHSVETTNHFIAQQTIACCMETLRVESVLYNTLDCAIRSTHEYN